MRNCQICQSTGYHLVQGISFFCSCEQGMVEKNYFKQVYGDMTISDKTELEQLKNDYLDYRDLIVTLNQSGLNEFKNFFIHNEGIAFLEGKLLAEKLIKIEDTISETLKLGASVAEPLAPFEICIVREEVKAPAAAPAPSSPTLDTLIKDKKTTTTTTKEETPMARTKVDMMKTGAKDIGRAIQAGAVQGTVGAINRQVVKQIEDRLGDKFPEALRNEAGRKALEVAIPSLVAMACALDENKKIPGHDHIQRAATLALTDASADAVSGLFALLFTEVMPFMQQYAEAGKMLADQEEVTEVEEVEDFTATIRKMKQKAHAA